MTYGKTYNKSPRRINHKETKGNIENSKKTHFEFAVYKQWLCGEGCPQFRQCILPDIRNT